MLLGVSGYAMGGIEDCVARAEWELRDDWFDILAGKGRNIH